jgi:membrane protein DedA with SNARE-associated domain
MKWLPYLGIWFSAAVEGEIVYVGAVVLAQIGKLNPLGVLVAGALGGSAGDQLWFYIFRTRLATWMDRFTAVARRRDQIRARVRRHTNAMVLMIRFMPGLRITICAVCAYAQIQPVRFSLLSLVSGTAWAGAIMFLVMVAGPTVFNRLGLHGWMAAIIPAVVVLLLFHWVSRAEKREPSGP